MAEENTQRSGFDWTLEDSGQVYCEGETASAQACGLLADLLQPMEIYDWTYHVVGKDEKGKDLIATRWHQNGKADGCFYWRGWHSAFEDAKDSDPRSQLAQRASQTAALDLAAGVLFLSALAGFTTLRLSPERQWRPLAANPVLHFQFGPGYAVASDGAQVLLLDRCRLQEGTRFFLAHRNNIIGNATGSPTPVKSRGTQKKPKLDPVALAQQLLAQLLAE